MNVSGTHHLAAPRTDVFRAICDPGVLMEILPGCDAIERVSATEYEGRLTLRLPGVVGSYRTSVRLVDAVEPERSGLEGRLEGTMGSIRGRANFVLGEVADGTVLEYAGSGVIQGPLAALDSRFAERFAGIADLPGPARPGPSPCPGRIPGGLPGRAAFNHGGARVTVSNYFLPGSVPEALGLLEAHGSSLLVIAGGTVAMPLINEGISQPPKVMGLRRTGLDRIEEAGGELRIGATATLTQLADHDAIPMLREAAGRTASWSIRNMGTVGGNLFTPPPGGDVAVALLALDASVTLTGPRVVRILPLVDFYTGFMTTDLRPDELVTSISVPIEPGLATFVKFGRKHANTPAVVTLAVHVIRDGGTVTRARIALGAVGPHPIRAARAEAAIVGTRLEQGAVAAAAEAAVDECAAFTDGVASEWYRRRMVAVFVERALADLAGRPDERGE